MGLKRLSRSSSGSGRRFEELEVVPVPLEVGVAVAVVPDSSWMGDGTSICVIPCIRDLRFIGFSV